MRIMLSAITVFFTLAFVIYLLFRQRTQHLSRVQANLDGYWDSSKEKRQFRRFKKRLSVDCIVPEMPGDQYKTFSHDISGQGVCLNVPEIMPKGSRVKLKIGIPDKTTLNVVGEVVWVKEVAQDPAELKRIFSAGIRFFALDKKDKAALDNFLIETCSMAHPKT
jgi:hypothetical protein